MAGSKHAAEISLKLKTDISKQVAAARKTMTGLHHQIKQVQRDLNQMVKTFMRLDVKRLASVNSQFKGLAKNIDNSNSSMKGLGRSASATAAKIKHVTNGLGNNKPYKNIKNMNGGLSRMKMLLAGISMYSTFSFGQSVVTAASDVVEAQNLFDVVFKDIKGEAKEVQNQMQETFGISVPTYSQNVAGLGSIFKSLGADSYDALKLANDGFKQALDISSAWNTSIEDALAKVRSGITGETEPLKRVGIDVSVAGMEEFAKQSGYVWNDLNKIQQSMLRLEKIQFSIDRSGISGDYIRTMDEFANRTKRLQEMWIGVKAIIGEELTKSLNELLGKILDNKEAIKGMAVDFGEALNKIYDIIVEITKFFKEHGEMIKLFGTMAAGGIITIKLAGLTSAGIAALTALAANPGILAVLAGGAAAAGGGYLWSQRDKRPYHERQEDWDKRNPWKDWDLEEARKARANFHKNGGKGVTPYNGIYGYDHDWGSQKKTEEEVNALLNSNTGVDLDKYASDIAAKEALDGIMKGYEAAIASINDLGLALGDTNELRLATDQYNTAVMTVKKMYKEGLAGTEEYAQIIEDVKKFAELREEIKTNQEAAIEAEKARKKKEEEVYNNERRGIELTANLQTTHSPIESYKLLIADLTKEYDKQLKLASKDLKLTDDEIKKLKELSDEKKKYTDEVERLNDELKNATDWSENFRNIGNMFKDVGDAFDSDWVKQTGSIFGSMGTSAKAFKNWDKSAQAFSGFLQGGAVTLQEFGEAASNMGEAIGSTMGTIQGMTAITGGNQLGATIGGILGAAGGAMIGSMFGSAAIGAQIGGGAGAAFGGLFGPGESNEAERQARREEQMMVSANIFKEAVEKFVEGVATTGGLGQAFETMSKLTDGSLDRGHIYSTISKSKSAAARGSAPDEMYFSDLEKLLPTYNRKEIETLWKATFGNLEWKDREHNVISTGYGKRHGSLPVNVLTEAVYNANKSINESMKNIIEGVIDFTQKGVQDAVINGFANGTDTVMPTITKDVESSLRQVFTNTKLFLTASDNFTNMFQDKIGDMLKDNENLSIDLDAKNLDSFEDYIKFFTEYTELANEEIKKIMESMGLVSEGAIGAGGALKDAVTNAISDGMLDALNTDSVENLASSIGTAIYDSVRSSLIEAYAESYVAKLDLEKYMGEIDFENLAPDDAMKAIQDALDRLNGELEKDGFSPATTGRTPDNVISSDVEYETQGAQITNNYKQYIVKIDDSFVSVESLTELEQELENRGFVKMDDDEI